MKILGVETSCDETAAAVIEDGVSILSNVVSSQVEIHARYGGIVPEVASRQHLLSIIPVLNQAMGEAKVGWEDIDAIGVTAGPGLPGSLLVGVNMAKALSWAHNLPLVGVNHLEAHIYARWLEPEPPQAFPCLCLIVSGGHTELVLMKGHGAYQSLGRTRDDAAGEAFDKASRLLGLGYPGGPAIQKAAARGNAHFRLPRALLKDSYDFSFSGLKTALQRYVEQSTGTRPEGQPGVHSYDLAASVQEAVVEVLTIKAIKAAQDFNARYIILAGGVAANSRLREWLTQRSPIPVLIPRLSLCTDNAAMVAACGYFRFQAGHRDGWDMDVISGWRIGA